jgi:hypothetical protein
MSDSKHYMTADTSTSQEAAKPTNTSERPILSVQEQELRQKSARAEAEQTTAAVNEKFRKNPDWTPPY